MQSVIIIHEGTREDVLTGVTLYTGRLLCRGAPPPGLPQGW